MSAVELFPNFVNQYAIQLDSILYEGDSRPFNPLCGSGLLQNPRRIGNARKCRAQPLIEASAARRGESALSTGGDRFCSKCGAQLVSDAIYCQKCGALVQPTKGPIGSWLDWRAQRRELRAQRRAERHGRTSTSPVVTKIVEKEVVKVPCKYCGTLVAIAAETKCPGCGAPITVQS